MRICVYIYIYIYIYIYMYRYLSLYIYIYSLSLPPPVSALAADDPCGRLPLSLIGMSSLKISIVTSCS